MRIPQTQPFNSLLRDQYCETLEQGTRREDFQFSLARSVIAKIGLAKEWCCGNFQFSLARSAENAFVCSYILYVLSILSCEIS